MLKIQGCPHKILKSLPVDHKASDIFLVSFPKSGNTWLRFLTASLIKVQRQIQRDINFFNIQEYVPDIHISRNIGSDGIFGQPDLPRIIKSHAEYNPYYNRVVLLVRDPKDALVSYYFYLRERNKIPVDLNISSFLRSSKYGARAWRRHAESWYLTFKQGQNIQVFKYEDLLSNPEESSIKLMDLLGIPITQEEVALALSLSSKERMRESEQKHRSTYITQTQKTSFVRKDDVIRGKELSLEDKSYIKNETQDIAGMLGYSH